MAVNLFCASFGRSLALLCAVWTVLLAAPISAAPLVRMGYVIPSNRSQQSDAVANLQQYLPTVQNWYAEQMDRYGFGRKTFRYETLPDGVTPRVHLANTTQTDADIRTDIWGNTISGATSAGLPIWSSQQVWMLVSEAHLEQPNGDIIGGTALARALARGMTPAWRWSAAAPCFGCDRAC